MARRLRGGNRGKKNRGVAENAGPLKVWSSRKPGKFFSKALLLKEIVLCEDPPPLGVNKSRVMKGGRQGSKFAVCRTLVLLHRIQNFRLESSGLSFSLICYSAGFLLVWVPYWGRYRGTTRECVPLGKKWARIPLRYV